jgi:hypothetical protein
MAYVSQRSDFVKRRSRVMSPCMLERIDRMRSITIADVLGAVKEMPEVGMFYTAEEYNSLIKYLENRNEVGEGNEFKHKSNTSWWRVEKEVLTEWSAYNHIIYLALHTLRQR